MRAQHSTIPTLQSSVKPSVSRAPARDPICLREKLFAILEVTILIGTALAVLIHPELVMIVALVVAGFFVVTLAVLDDHFKPHG